MKLFWSPSATSARNGTRGRVGEMECNPVSALPQRRAAHIVIACAGGCLEFRPRRSSEERSLEGDAAQLAPRFPQSTAHTLKQWAAGLSDPGSPARLLDAVI